MSKKSSTFALHLKRCTTFDTLTTQAAAAALIVCRSTRLPPIRCATCTKGLQTHCRAAWVLCRLGKARKPAAAACCLVFRPSVGAVLPLQKAYFCRLGVLYTYTKRKKATAKKGGAN